MPSPLPSARAPRRGLAVVAAAALVGAPLLTGSPAGANDAVEPAAGQPPLITFSGGCGLLGIGGRSTPDVSTARVVAGADLRFANQLGQRATIWLGEQTNATVPAGGEADVTFAEVGTVPVSMQISCLLGKPVGEVAVEVVPPDPAPPGSPSLPPPPPVPPASSPSGGLGTATESAGAGAGAGDGVAPPGSEAVDGGSGTLNGDGSGAPPAGADGSFGGGQLDSPADGPMSGPGGAESAPITDQSSGVEGGAELGEVATVDPPNVGQSSDVTPASRTRGDDGVIGLLALVATVCLVGASVGAARVLLSRRASAAKWA